MSCVTEITTAINTSHNNNVASHELVIPASEIHGLEESVTTHKEKKEFPFHDPSPLRISDWDTEMVSSDAMYQLLPGQKGITAKMYHGGAAQGDTVHGGAESQQRTGHVPYPETSP